MKLFIIRIIGVFLLSQVTACNDKGNKNIPPSVNAGEDITVSEQTNVDLSGTATDIDGLISSAQWQQISGIIVPLETHDEYKVSFITPTTTSRLTLEFEFRAIDTKGAIASDTIKVIVEPVNTPPTLIISPNFSVVEGKDAYLIANAIDNDGHIVNYQWTQINGSEVALIDANTASASFIAPIITQDETLTFEVIVTDNEAAYTTEEVIVTITDILKVEATGKLNDTGVSLCADYAFDDGSGNHDNQISCDETVDDDGDPLPYGQDGHSGRDLIDAEHNDGHAGFSFTKIDVNGDPLPLNADNWSCVHDNVTGLLWEVKSIDGLQQNNNTYTWYNLNSLDNGGSTGFSDGGNCVGSSCDTVSYVNMVNSIGLCGAYNWRLPTKQEYFSILNFSSEPKIDLNFFPNTSGFYWSSTPVASNMFNAWYVRFTDGNDASGGKQGLWHIRLVREKE